MEDVLRSQAERFAAALAGQLGMELDFSLASLPRLDAALAEWLDFAEVYAAPGEQFDALALPLAAYVGEVLVRSNSARWLLEPAPFAPDEPALLLASGEAVAIVEAARLVLQRVALPSFARLASR